MNSNEMDSENKERLFEYLMKLAVDNPNNYEVGEKVRELAIKKGYIYADRTKDKREK